MTVSFIPMKSSLFMILMVALVHNYQVSAFVPVSSHHPFMLQSVKVSSNDNIDKLRESSERLRKEAKDLEDALGEKRTPVNSIPDTNPTYTTLADATWTCTYRFTSDPRNEEDREKETSLYSGKFTIKFLADGYTNLISQEPSGMSCIVIDKVWGWDKEISNEDSLEYLLFSTSVTLPSDDKFAPNESIRYYWQARVDRSSSGTLTLKDGSITVKKDVRPPGGFWGAFSGAGILAQFRLVGNFSCKASRE